MSTTTQHDRTNRTDAAERPAPTAPPVAAATTATRRLLACGVVAGPVYVGVAAAQVLTREGFDITRHPVSLLSNGDLGWIQIANFVLTGLLTIAAAVGLHRTLAPSRCGRWAARLLGVYGASLVAAGAFVADPSFGFPLGTPDGPPAVITGHGVAHFGVGGVGFLALVTACLLLGRRFARLGLRGWATSSRATGVLFLAAFAGIASGGGLPVLNIAFTVAVVLAWTFIALLSARVTAITAGLRR